jgi:hypothetical protein
VGWRGEEDRQPTSPEFDGGYVLYCILASEEERAAMAEPIGWRHVLDPNVSMEENVCIL